MRYLPNKISFSFFIKIFIALVFILILLTTIIIQINYSKTLENLKSLELEHLKLMQSESLEMLDIVHDDISFIANLEASKTFLDEADFENNPEIVDIYRNFLLSNTYYKQISLLNEDGMEILRLSFNNGDVTLASKESLGYEHESEVFFKAMQIKNDEIYVSPLSLNIENSLIEYPYIPIIQISKPLTSSKGKSGVVVFNYYGDELLDHFVSQGNHEFDVEPDIILLTGDGYYIKSPIEDNNWGYIFKDKQNITFKNQFPSLWTKINNYVNGQILDKTNGLYTFTHLKAKPSISSDKFSAFNSLILVSYFNEQKLDLLKYHLIQMYLNVFILLFVLAIIISYVISIWYYQIKQRELTLIHAKQTSEFTNHLNSNFFAYIKQEVKAPMHTIMGMCTIALQDHIRDDTRKYFVNIYNSANSLTRIIDDIYDLSILESNKFTIMHVAFNLNELFNSLQGSFNDDLSKAPVHYIYKFDPNIEKFLYGDPHRLKQVLINLITNATKFTKEGYIQVDFELLSQDKTTAKIRFSVTDTGKGISKNDVDRLFKDFQEISNDLDDLINGANIALSISEKIIHLMGGSINIHSQENIGSKFYFDLDFDIAPQSEVKFIEKENPVLSSNLASLNTITKKNVILDSKNILIVDDNEYNQVLIQELLNKINCNTYVAYDVISSLEALKMSHFHLVIMDLQLPLVDGFEITREIRKLYSSEILPIIGMSAKHLGQDQESSLELGINAFLHKPIIINEFYLTVSRFLELDMYKYYEKYIKLPSLISPSIINFEVALPNFNYNMENFYYALLDCILETRIFIRQLSQLNEPEYKVEFENILQSKKKQYQSLGLYQIKDLFDTFDMSSILNNKDVFNEYIKEINKCIDRLNVQTQKIKIVYLNSHSPEMESNEMDTWEKAYQSALVTGDLIEMRKLIKQINLDWIKSENLKASIELAITFDYKKALDILNTEETN